MEQVEVCIVGSGPAGIATAAALVKKKPALRDRIVILEKSRHPRHKLCGGGLTPWVDRTLAELELEAPVRDFQVERVMFYLTDDPIEFDIPGMMRTIRRNEFDAALASSIRAKGVRLLEETTVVKLAEESKGIRVETSGGDFFAKIVVGADGAKSVVRRSLFREIPSRVSRLIEVLVPARNGCVREFHSKTVTIDFRPMQQGLQGYVWDFPCWIEEQPYFNVGLFDSRIHDRKDIPRADLPALLDAHLSERGLEPDTRIMGHPERWFHPTDRFSRPRVLLAGDSAGIEPWLGEGISASLAYGPIAAETIIHALESGDYSLADYHERILADHVGKFLRRNRLVASLFYARRFKAVLPAFGHLLKTYLQFKHWRQAKNES